jgi:hypothetical protein
LVTKRAVQAELAEALIPEGESLDALQALLRAAEPLCNFEEAAHESCPLCRRTLGNMEVHLFAQYHALLQGNLERELTALKGDLKKAAAIIERIRGMNVSKWAGWQTDMRRLVEAFVNTHVFNDQRYQYKQKSNNVSDFRHFTKLVPLVPTEAMTFRDLYAKLSVAEHDDPRNAFVNTDKATFQARYDQILVIEAAIVSRKPLRA